MVENALNWLYGLSPLETEAVGWAFIAISIGAVFVVSWIVTTVKMPKFRDWRL